MNSADVRTLKNELHRFGPKPCRSCQFIFGFGIFVFLVSLTLALFAYKGVPPSSVIPVESIPRDKPVTRTEERVILEDLRTFVRTGAQEQGMQVDVQASHEGDEARKKAKIVMYPAP